MPPLSEDSSEKKDEGRAGPIQPAAVAPVGDRNTPPPRSERGGLPLADYLSLPPLSDNLGSYLLLEVENDVRLRYALRVLSAWSMGSRGAQEALSAWLLTAQQRDAGVGTKPG